MLTGMRFRNFKSWHDTNEVRLAPITVFFGANSSGKTSLLQAILMLRQTADSADRFVPLNLGDRSSLVNLGDFLSVSHRHNPDAEIELSLSWQTAKPLQILDPAEPNRMLLESEQGGFSTTVQGNSLNVLPGKALRMSVTRMEHRIGKAAFGMRRKGNGYELYERDSPFGLARAPGRPWELPRPVKCYGFPDQVRAYYQNASFLADLELAFEEQLGRTYYLGPLRANPERDYRFSGSQPADMGRSGEKAIDAILASRDRGELIALGKGRKRQSLEEYVGHWLHDLGLAAEFRVETASEGGQIFQVLVKKTSDSAEVLITDVGFGVSQILPVVVLCFYAPQGSTIILEQPEIHLHPAVQAKLADVIIDAYRKRQVQVIIESHSEHLLRRLQRRLAEGELTEKEVAMYFCEADGPASNLVSLQLDMFGNVANWPRDFFGDQMGEVAETQLARLRRMHQEAA